MDKELALIFEYSKAPESLKTVAQAHRTNSNLLQKKQAQLKAIESGLKEAQKAYDETAKAFKAELNAWQPTGV